MIREANRDDLKDILELYLDLHETEIPEDSEHLSDTWPFGRNRWRYPR